MIMGTVEHDIRNSTAHLNGFPNRIGLLEVQPDKVKRHNRELLCSVSKHQRPRKEIIMDSGAALDRTDRRCVRRRRDRDLRRSRRDLSAVLHPGTNGCRLTAAAAPSVSSARYIQS